MLQVALSTRVAPAQQRCVPARRRRVACSASADTSGPIRVERAASEARIKELGCRSWPTWSCGVSTFPWSYGDTETSLLVEGEVTVTPTQPPGPAVTLRPGDVATFPAGLACTWAVTKALRKHYNFS